MKKCEKKNPFYLLHCLSSKYLLNIIDYLFNVINIYENILLYFNTINYAINLYVLYYNKISN